MLTTLLDTLWSSEHVEDPTTPSAEVLTKIAGGFAYTRVLLRRTLILTVVMALIVILAGSVTYFAREQQLARATAERQARIAMSRKLAAEAREASRTHPVRAVLLGTEAIHATTRVSEPPTIAAEQTLRDILNQMGGQALPGQQGPIQAIAIHPHGLFAAAGGEDANIRIWDLTKSNLDAPTHSLAGTAAVTALTFDAIGKHLIAGYDDGTLHVWSFSNCGPGRTPADLFKFNNAIQAIVLHPSAPVVFVADIKGNVRRHAYSNDDPLPRHADLGKAGFRPNLSVSNDGRWLGASTSIGRSVSLWTLDNNLQAEPTSPVTSDRSKIRAHAFGASGNMLVTGHSDGFLYIWGLDRAGNHRRIRRLPPQDDESIAALAVAPEDRWVVAASSKRVSLWQLDAADPAATRTTLLDESMLGRLFPEVSFEASDVFSSVYFSRAGARLIAVRGNSAFLWDTSKFSATEAKPNLLRGHEGNVDLAVFSNSGSRLLTASLSQYFLKDDNVPRLWNLDGAAFTGPRAIGLATAKIIKSPVITPDHRLLAGINDDTEVIAGDLWQDEPLRQHRVLFVDQSIGQLLVVTRDLSLIVAGHGTGEAYGVRLWRRNEENDSYTKSRLTTEDDPIELVKASHSGKYLAARRGKDRLALISFPD